MSDGLVCDGCGDALLGDSDVRYVLEVRGFAAYDPLEITRADLARRDLGAEMSELLGKMAEQDAAELEADVFQEFRYDLCPRCWKRYRADPLRGLANEPRRGEDEF